MSEIGAVRLFETAGPVVVPSLSGLDAALETIRRSASSQRELGGRFERLMCRVLLEHPGEFRGRFPQVVPWGEWEGRDGPDGAVDACRCRADAEEPVSSPSREWNPSWGTVDEGQLPERAAADRPASVRRL